MPNLFLHKDISFPRNKNNLLGEKDSRFLVINDLQIKSIIYYFSAILNLFF